MGTITRQEAIKRLSKITNVGEEYTVAVKSLELWDSFIERLAEKCNGAVTPAEWTVNRKAIELIKSEFDEAIG